MYPNFVLIRIWWNGGSTKNVRSSQHVVDIDTIYEYMYSQDMYHADIDTIYTGGGNGYGIQSISTWSEWARHTVDQYLDWMDTVYSRSVPGRNGHGIADQWLERAVNRFLRHFRVAPDEVLVRVGAVELCPGDGVRALALLGLLEELLTRRQNAAQRQLRQNAAVDLKPQLSTQISSVQFDQSASSCTIAHLSLHVGYTLEIGQIFYVTLRFFQFSFAQRGSLIYLDIKTKTSEILSVQLSPRISTQFEQPPSSCNCSPKFT